MHTRKNNGQMAEDIAAEKSLLLADPERDVNSYENQCLMQRSLNKNTCYHYKPWYEQDWYLKR
jgi:hypothetical protein